MKEYICAGCNKTIKLDGNISFSELCPECGEYLHACRNCAFYQKNASGGCLEPAAEFVADKEMKNFCEYFIFRKPAEKRAAVKDLKSGFEKLFSKSDG